MTCPGLMAALLAFLRPMEVFATPAAADEFIALVLAVCGVPNKDCDEWRHARRTSTELAQKVRPNRWGLCLCGLLYGRVGFLSSNKHFYFNYLRNIASNIPPNVPPKNRRREQFRRQLVVWMRSGGDTPSRFSLTAASGYECAQGVGVVCRPLTWVRQYKTQLCDFPMLADFLVQYWTGAGSAA